MDADSNTLNIKIDGKALPVARGKMLIEVADDNGIYIPRFCYHKALSVAANCRMCLVEVEKAPKPLPACSTPVMDGMAVWTRSELAVEAQKSVMEFLLINHPLDCPICDQGGECELQDLAVGYGSDISRYQEAKRVVQDKNIGPLIQTDMTRCIHCTRCVRFGEEIAGLRELGSIGRGENMEIGTYIEKSVRSELSGNIIDVCPVGALTSKPFRFSARAWEMVQKFGIAPHDSVGSNLHLHIRDDRVMRVVPAENEVVNEVWISDRDRFSYEGLYSDDRLRVPMIKRAGTWRETDWESALEFTYHGLKKILSEYGPAQLGGLVSPAATLEELYLFQKLLRGLDCNNIDHRLRQHDFSQQEADPIFPYLGQSLVELETVDTLLLIGSDIRREQPLVNHRLRKASLKGAKIMAINTVDYDFNYELTHRLIIPPAEYPLVLAGIIKALVEMPGVNSEPQLLALIESYDIQETHRMIANRLIAADNGTILLGNLATAHSQYSLLKYLAANIAEMSGVKLGFLAEAANTVGANLAGVLPHRRPGGNRVERVGLHVDAMLDQSLRAYFMLGVEAELDCWDGHQALQAMLAADFVVALTAYNSPTMQEYADVLLPIALFAETSGTYINTVGQPQSFEAAVPPFGQARPAWKILRVIGNLFELEGFDYNISKDIREEVLNIIAQLAPDNTGKWSAPEAIAPVNGVLQRIAQVPMNAIDPMTRRALALQKTTDVADGAVHINSKIAADLGVVAGDKVTAQQKAELLLIPVVIDEQISDGCALIHAAQDSHARLGAWYGEISLRKA